MRLFLRFWKKEEDKRLSKTLELVRKYSIALHKIAAFESRSSVSTLKGISKIDMDSELTEGIGIARKALNIPNNRNYHDSIHWR